MSDPREPVRLRDLRSDADPELRRLIGTAKHAAPDGARRRALEQRILQQVELSSPKKHDAGVPEASMRESRWVWLRADRPALAKLLVAVGLAATAGLVGTIKLTQSERAQRGATISQAGSSSLEPDKADAPRPAGPVVQAARAAVPGDDQPAHLQEDQTTQEPRLREQPPTAARGHQPRSVAPAAPSEHATSTRADSGTRRVRDVKASRSTAASPANAHSAETSGDATPNGARADNSGVPRQTNVAPELALLAHAQRALHDNPTLALELADQHARAYPAGAFVEEREAIAIEALIASGHALEGRARGRAFLERHKGSAYAPRVTNLIRSAP